MTAATDRFAHLPPLQRAYLALEQAQSRLEALQSARHEPIAIIGLGCRFPGGEGPDAFWRVLRDGLDMVTTAPADRWDSQLVARTLHRLNPASAPTVEAAFLDQVDQFDAAYFGISGREASCMDPQQRLLLEVVQDALDDAGLAAERLAGSNTGVFVGVHSQSSDYLYMQAGDAAHVDAFTATGTAHSVVAGRVSYVLDLRGPSIALDTACSSSLVAVHLASQSLRNGECDLCLAGGVNLRLSPEFMFATVQMGTASPSGRCRAFDADADGIVFGEGCGVVALKRLSDALRDGDSIWAVVRGSAVNQDGRSAGLAAPNGLAQQAVLRQAWQDAGVSASEIDLIEAHGTGTPLGDPIEIEALAEVLGPAREGGPVCAVGSVKTNIGHLEGAAGIASLIKVVLALRHRAIPPTLHLRQLNPHIALNGAAIEFPTTLRPWPAGPRRRLAGVSSFGWSGTNAHIVLEEAPEQPATAGAAPEREQRLFLPLSARSPEALRSLAHAYRTLLASDAPADEVCYSAGTRRTHHAFRHAVCGSSLADLVAQLDDYLASDAAGAQLGIGSARRKVVFVFPGQGGQWAGMGRTLLAREPAFREALVACDLALRPYLGRDLSELLADPQAAWLNEIDQLQPVLFAVQVGLAALWRAWGIEPDAVVGHSLGEVAAAYVSGALSLDDAARVIGTRSRLLRRVQGQGAMVLVELPAAEAEAAVTHEAGASLGAVNGPRSSVLAGERAALERVVAQLEGQGVFCRWVKVAVAAHSPQVDPLRAELEATLATVSATPPVVPFYSTVTPGEAAPRLDGAYWSRNLRAPVRFWEAIQRLAAAGHTVFLELSPHPTLQTNIDDGLRQLGRPGQALASLRRGQDESATLLHTLAALYTQGADINWRGLYPAGGRKVRLPAYPWQRARYWLPEARPGLRRMAGAANGHDHPLLGRPLILASQPDLRLWEHELDTSLRPYLADHQVQGETVLPATAYLELALAAAREAFGDDPVVLERINFRRVLIVPSDRAVMIQVALTITAPGIATFQLASRSIESAAAAWTIHADGYVRQVEIEMSDGPETPAAVQARCTEQMTSAELYAAMEAQGVQYGPRFRGVEHLWRRAGEAIGSINVPAALAGEATPDHIHPAVLDACLQVMAAAVPQQRSGAGQAATFLPAGVHAVWLASHSGQQLWSHARLVDNSGAPDELNATVDVYAEDGRRVGRLQGLALRPVDSGRRERTAPDELSTWLHELRWVPATLTPPVELAVPVTDRGPWLILGGPSGLGGDLATRLRAQGEQAVLVSMGAAYQALAADHYVLDLARPADFGLLLKAVGGRAGANARRPGVRGIVVLWPLELDPRAVESAAALSCTGVMHLVQALARAGWRDAPRLWLVTRGAQGVTPRDTAAGVGQAAVWGLGRTIAFEQPELDCTLVDLEADGETSEVDALMGELRLADREREVALRAGQRRVARLTRVATPGEAGQPTARLAPAGDRPFRLEIRQPGTLDDLVLRATERRAPGPGEIEIAVRAAGLNFLDVLLALGALPDEEGSAYGTGPRLGGECAGHVVAVGAGVTDLAVGQAVVGLAPWCFGRYVTTARALVVPLPEGLATERAAGIPIAFLTADYALRQVAHLARGERVLIHAATGGLGLAAVQIAQQLGAEVFATAGSAAKRALLQSLGVRHVADSRSLNFAEAFRAATGGEGVDVVLNSLAGPFIPASLELLRPHGRFIELGKRDYYADRPLPARPFLRNLSFSLVDLRGFAYERPAQFQALLQDVLARIERGELQPVATSVVPVAEVAAAFRTMAQAQHTGKLVIALDQAAHTPIAPAAETKSKPIQSDRTYVITGGLGGLGLKVAAWLLDQGARHLALLGRSAPTEASVPAVAALRTRGAQVTVLQTDVADRGQLAAALERVRAELPPLAGVIHAAAVLDDGLLLQLTPERLQRVLAPKVAGAWNLHALTQTDALDCFVMFSSASGLLGAPGQANYAAANAFLDALAYHRRAAGLPALSINWGPWSEVGLAAAQDNRGQRLATRGVHSLSPAQGLALLGRLMASDMTQVGVMPFNLRQWRQFYPKVAGSPLYSLLSDEVEAPTTHGRPSLRLALSAAPPAERRQLLEAHLIDQVAQVLRIERSRIDPQVPLSSLGFESLMALEYRNRLEASLELTLPATLVWGYPTVAALAPHLAERMELALDDQPSNAIVVAAPMASPGEAAPTEFALPVRQALEALSQLSEAEAMRALLEGDELRGEQR